MPLSLAALEEAPRLSMTWTGGAAISGSPTWAIQSLSWDLPGGYMPGAAAPTDAGFSPTSYVFNGTTYSALPQDASIIRFQQDGSVHAHRCALYDLLWLGPAVATTGTVTVGSAPLPARDLLGGTDGVNCQLVAWATGGVTVSASYTNSAGVSGRTSSVAITAAGGPWVLPLMAGDEGVKSVESMSSTHASRIPRLGIVRQVASTRITTISGGLVGEPVSSRLSYLSVLKAGTLLHHAPAHMSNLTGRVNNVIVELALL